MGVVDGAGRTEALEKEASESYQGHDAPKDGIEPDEGDGEAGHPARNVPTPLGLGDDQQAIKGDEYQGVDGHKTEGSGGRPVEVTHWKVKWTGFKRSKLVW